MKSIFRVRYLVLLLAGCSSSAPPRASAVRIESRSQLIGGQRALGEVGDFKLSNGIIHAIIQDVGHSRGFGVFGGSLIDVDLVRGSKASSATGTAGNDWFTEMFPAFFLEAIEPQKVEVLADGSAGPAIIRVSGQGNDFLSLTRSINDLVLPPTPLDYTVDYILEPGKQYLKIVVTLTNADKTKEAGFPLAVPLGFVTLLGEGQRLFVPGKGGYDMRFRLEEVYKGPSSLEALPGEVTTMVATEGEGVSYAVAAANPRGDNYMETARKRDPQFYPDAKPDSLLIPMAFSSFLGTFWGMPPKALAPGKSYSFAGYLAVGNGDVASAQKVVYSINDASEVDGRTPTPTGTISGRVREELTGSAVAGLTVVLQDDQGHYVSSARSQKDGSYTAAVPPGRYRAYAVDSVRTPKLSGEYVEVAADALARIDLLVERAATLSVTVLDERGRRLPAKISIEAVYGHVGAEPPRSFLYNLRVGERMRPSDFDADTDEPQTRRYLEKVFFAPHGTAGKAIRPGSYRVWASRGPEYDLASADVELKAGELRELSLTLRQVMKTPGYVSTDFHVHSVNSVDSEMSSSDRVASYAVEGVDFLSSTDHNFVTDFAPTVEALGLQDWVKTTVGLELTTLEMGHFNAFPLVLEKGAVTHGSFNWFRRPPGELFAQLRSLGKYEGKTIVQVNHPRDTILGYFSQYNMSAYTTEILPPTSAFTLDRTIYTPESFSLDFDALEVFNGKHAEQLFHYRVPQNPGSGPEPTLPFCTPGGPAECIQAVGEILEQTFEGSKVNPVYAGALEDYYTLTARGRRLTAMGNSDSHSAKAEAGLPRSYVWVGDTADGSMMGLSEEAVMDGIRTQKVVVTNGPFVELFVNEQPVGSEVVAPEGNVTVRIKVQAAPWVDVSKVVLKRGGKDQQKIPQVVAEYTVAPSEELVRLEETKELFGIPDDSFFVVEVSGERPMWPVYTPLEIASIQLNEIIGSLGATFGYTNKYGKYRPVQEQQIKPFAFTNPVYVVRAKKQALAAKRLVLPLGQTQPHQPAKVPDLRRLFGQFHADLE
ncbi:MAG: carboxypeptidase regulatory-like domain-containing protein [Myxococcota bacterium]